MFTAEQAAASLWDYGEDDLIGRARALDLNELERAWAIASDYWDPAFELPTARRVTNNLVMAFSVVTLLEGKLRPLARDRRRPQSAKPEELRDPPQPTTSDVMAAVRSASARGDRSQPRPPASPAQRRSLLHRRSKPFTR